MGFFNKTRLLLDSYASKVESIDDKTIGRLFEEKAKNQTKDIDLNTLKKYKYFEDNEFRTKLDKHQAIGLAYSFFKSLHNTKAKEAIKNLEGKNKNIEIIINQGNKANGKLERPQQDNLKMNCCFVGDLRDVYTLVHEATHTLDIKNGDISTRRILGEVAPSCMESLLDKFLINLPDKELYGIDENELREDINDRKIIRFIEHYGNAKSFNRAMEKGNGRSLITEKDSRYMLAEIYQAKFNHFDYKTKEKKIFKFIKCVENNKFDKANKIFDMNFANETEKRVEDAINDIKILINVKLLQHKNSFKNNTFVQGNRAFELHKSRYEKNDKQMER